MLIVALLECMRGLKDLRCKKKLISVFNLAITESELDLSYQKLTLEDIKNLCEALLENRLVTSLNLSANEIDFEGAIILADFLQKNTTLRILNLQYNKIDDKGATVLMSILEKTSLTSLDLRCNKIGSKGIMIMANTSAISHGSVGEKHWLLEGKYSDEIYELFQKAMEMNAPRKSLVRTIAVMSHCLDNAPGLIDAYRKTFILNSPKSLSVREKSNLNTRRVYKCQL